MRSKVKSVIKSIKNEQIKNKSRTTLYVASGVRHTTHAITYLVACE